MVRLTNWSDERPIEASTIWTYVFNPTKPSVPGIYIILIVLQIVWISVFSNLNFNYFWGVSTLAGASKSALISYEETLFLINSDNFWKF